MSTNAVELQPDPDEVLQVEPAGHEPIVKVSQQGPVRTQSLPTKGGATTTKNVPTFPATLQILRPDHRRAKADLITSAAVYVAYGKANAQDLSTMALLPAGVRLPVSGTIEVWVTCSTGTPTVSVFTELWATGDGSGD
jgi:hypothetical protein